MALSRVAQIKEWINILEEETNKSEDESLNSPDSKEETLSSPDPDPAPEEVSAGAQPQDEESEDGESIDCSDCGTSFSFTAEQRKEFEERGYQSPKRCMECRMKRRRQKELKNNSRKKKGRSQQRGRNPQQSSQNSGRDSGSSSRRDQGASSQETPYSNTPRGPMGNSYVAQGEKVKSHRDGMSSPNDSSYEESGLLPSDSGPSSDEDNFGNSIHYSSPGVRPQPSWKDDSPYEPWEGAHGMLLTTHENLKNNKPNRSKQENSKQNNSNNRNQNRGNGRNRHQNKNRGANKRKRVSHEIVCVTCGVTTRVPFKPIPGKPVFCPDCYKAARAENKSASNSKPPVDSSNPPEGKEMPETNPEVSE